MQTESKVKVAAPISIASWKKNQDQFLFEKDFTKYLKLLSFNELIEEYRAIVNDLSSGGNVSGELAFRSKQILLEFSDRLKINAEQFSSLDEIKKHIEAKVSSMSSGPTV